jgi:sulfur-oxidizing protein SoxZ
MTDVKPRVRVPKTAEVDEIIEIKTLIRHPMHSGRVIDGDGYTIPRQIITSFEAKFNGETIFSVEIKPSVSANPFITFPFKVTEAGTFEFIWTEDTGEVFNLSKKMKVE